MILKEAKNKVMVLGSKGTYTVNTFKDNGDLKSSKTFQSATVR